MGTLNTGQVVGDIFLTVEIAEKHLTPQFREELLKLSSEQLYDLIKKELIIMNAGSISRFTTPFGLILKMGKKTYISQKSSE
jgi:hypothetical protein